MARTTDLRSEMFRIGISCHPTFAEGGGAKLGGAELVTHGVPRSCKIDVGDFCTTIFFGQSDAEARTVPNTGRNLLSPL
jgi:hypothetical protein